MTKTSAQYVAEHRARETAKGKQRYERWLYPWEIEQVNVLIKQLREQSNENQAK